MIFTIPTFFQDVLEAVEFPTYILQGGGGSLIAVVPIGRKKFLHVIYKELSANDGFIITASYQSDFDDDLVIWREEDQN